MMFPLTGPIVPLLQQISSQSGDKIVVANVLEFDWLSVIRDEALGRAWIADDDED
jgi:hypothetical protein